MSEEILDIESINGGTFNQKIRKIMKKVNGMEKLVIRKESDYLNEGLIKEIKFLISLSGKAKKHFCKVQNYQIDKLPIFYETPFYKLKNMWKSIIEGDTDAEYCVKVIHKILNFMFKDLFSKNIENTGEDYLSKTIFSRIEERYEKLKEKSDVLRRFIEAEKIILEGKEYDNTYLIMGNLKRRKELLRQLTPKKTHMIHGDFHFSNFLIDNNNPNNFMLIDPKGEIRGYSYAYDLGKLWHSFHGKYDFIREGLFDLSYKLPLSKNRNKIIEVGIFKHKPSKAFDILEEIYDKREEFIDVCKQNLQEENIESQILFSEATHFCALAPFHLKGDGIEKEAIGRYLTGVKLLNEFIGKLK